MEPHSGTDTYARPQPQSETVRDRLDLIGEALELDRAEVAAAAKSQKAPDRLRRPPRAEHRLDHAGRPEALHSDDDPHTGSDDFTSLEAGGIVGMMLSCGPPGLFVAWLVLLLLLAPFGD